MDPALQLLLLGAGIALYVWADRRRLASWGRRQLARFVRAARAALDRLEPLTSPQGSPSEPAALVADGKVTLAAWRVLLNDDPDRAPHTLIVGPTGAGKTTFARALLADRPGQVAILTPKPDPDDWPGAPIVTIGDDGSFAELTAAFVALDAELRRRLVARKHRQPVGAPLTIVADDWPVLASECGKPAGDVFKLVARLGRSLRVRLVILSQSDRVKALGLDGEGDAVTNFARVELARGYRATLHTEGYALPLDTRQVAQAASRQVESGRWWVLPEAGTGAGVSGCSDALEELPAAPGNGRIEPAGKRGNAETVEVTAVERERIIAAAQVQPSRRAVCLAVFGSPSGRPYQKVKAVCDAEGLLLEAPVATA